MPQDKLQAVINIQTIQQLAASAIATLKDVDGLEEVVDTFYRIQDLATAGLEYIER